MNDPKLIKIEDYTYNLPDYKIAAYPLKNRDDSALLAYNKGKINKKQFREITDFLPADSLIIRNNSKVLNARLIFHKETGARIEIFCLSPADTDNYHDELNKTKTSKWKCIIGNRKKWKYGKLNSEIVIKGKSVIVEAELITKGESENIVEFSWYNENIKFGEIMENSGLTPIPPYLKRESENIDKTRYQTVYSCQEGSVAAPTAGLHFTDKVLKDLRYKNIEFADITLHVGTGTFQPVKSENAGDHPMHTEFFYADTNLLKTLKKYQGKITAVGTTSMRALESLLQAGIKAMEGKCGLEYNQEITQWEAYNRKQDISLKKVLDFMIDECEKKNIHEIKGKTSIMIAPGFPFLIPDILITNFHQPKSTLLLLIAAYIGKDWKKVYDFALNNDFRFLSYGDSSVLIPK